MFRQTGGDAFDTFLLKKYNMSTSDFEGQPQFYKDQLKADFVSGGSVSGAKPVYIASALNKNQVRVQCNTRAECDQFGKDDIEAELIRRGFLKVPQENRTAGPKEFSMNSTKPELVQILLNHNKREMARLAYLRKQTGHSMRGALPSEATNPSMYDHTSGLLRPEYLTQDHHGLTAYDFKGDKYQVFYLPKLNGYGGTAQWQKISGEGGALNPCDPAGNCRSLPTGLVLDNKGLPILDQLNYILHYGLSYRGKDDKIYILAPKKRKNLKNFSVHPTNALPEKNGTYQMHWVLASSNPWTTEPVSKGADEQKFFLPDGSVVTGKELNKLSLEQIWRMMMLLELMDPATQQSTYDKLKGLKLGPFGEQKIDGTRMGGPKRKTSLLDANDRADEEIKYQVAGLPQCGTLDSATGKITPANRCYTDSYIPGACVPHEEICFNSNYKGPWENSDRYGNNTQMKWAKTKSEELHRSGALESEAAYQQWKSQQAQTKLTTDMTQRYGILGDGDKVAATSDPSKAGDFYNKMGTTTVAGLKFNKDGGIDPSGLDATMMNRNKLTRADLDALKKMNN
jgi:hypothetical protein